MKLIINESGIKTLENNNGIELTCPIKQPVPTQNQLGSVSFIEHACNSKCVFFQIIDIPEKINEFNCLMARGTTTISEIVERKPSILQKLQP
jgi:hypothetical protein